MAKFDDDVAALATAIAADEAAIAAVQTLTASQANSITQLQTELASDAPDTTKLETLITQLQNDNQTLANVANVHAGGTVVTTAPPSATTPVDENPAAPVALPIDLPPTDVPVVTATNPAGFTVAEPSTVAKPTANANEI